MPLVLTPNGDTVDADGQGGSVTPAEVSDLVMARGFSVVPNKIVIHDANVDGDLDFESATIGATVEFRRCTFGGAINLEQAVAKGLYFLDECELHRIAGGQLRLAFNLVVMDSKVYGGITLTGAHIGGQLAFRATELRPFDGPALIADGLVVDQDMFCTKHFLAEGCVRLIGARIGGQFICDEGSVFNCPGGVALSASGLTVADHVIWSNGFVVQGRVDLTGSHIGGRLDLTGAELHHLGSRPALDLARASIDQNVICREDCTVEGKVLLADAKIGGNLWCEGGSFHNANNVAIEAIGLTVGRDVAFSRDNKGNGFLAEGVINLSDAEIHGSLNCAGGELRNPGKVTLAACGLKITRDALFGFDFVTDGTVDLTDATVGGDLNCTGGHFGHPDKSITCDRIKIAQSAQFGQDCYVAGELSMAGAQITADLVFAGLKLAACGPDVALSLREAVVGGKLTVGFVSEPRAAIELCWAKVGQLDDERANWPATVYLEGFVYGTIPSDSLNVRERLAWLRKNGRYVPQIYLQLASVYHTAGADNDSTTVAVAGEEARRKTLTGFIGTFKRGLALLLKWTVRYGYRPLQVLWWLIALEGVGVIVFIVLNNAGQLRPSGSVVRDFNPYLYTLDLLLPVVNLDQRHYWIPIGAASWVAAVFTIAGWILAGSLVVGAGRILKSR